MPNLNKCSCGLSVAKDMICVCNFIKKDMPNPKMPSFEIDQQLLLNDSPEMVFLYAIRAIGIILDQNSEELAALRKEVEELKKPCHHMEIVKIDCGCAGGSGDMCQMHYKQSLTP